MGQTGLEINTVFAIGPLAITTTVITTWFILLILGLFCWLATLRLSDSPGPVQTAIEALVIVIENAVAAHGFLKGPWAFRHLKSYYKSAGIPYSSLEH